MSSTVSTAHSWEAQKENAAPLERGRQVSSFGLRQSDTEKQNLKEKLRDYEALVSPSEDPKAKEMNDDPLSHWLSYIKFYQNSFPSDTRENFLIIERCVRALVKMKQYNNDDRFVSVCAKYADKTKDPGQVFKYLHQQKVGAHTALFWIAWAFVAEKDSDFPFAEQIFKKGLSKNAEPLQMLKLRHQQFQRRMSRHWLNSSKTNDELNDEYESGEQRKSSRSTLGGIARDRLRRNDRSQRRGHQVISQNPLTRRQNGSMRPGNNNEIDVNNTKGSFPIFVEEEGENAYNLDQDFGANERATIAREADRRKENTLAAERWNERGGMQSSYPKTGASTSRGKGPMPAFSVFVDEECAAENVRQEKVQEKQMNRQRQVRDERTFKERDTEGMAEKLFRDPVRYLKDPNRLQSENMVVPQRPDDHKMEKPIIERKSRAGFNKRLLKNENGEEQCFEEARARTGTYTTMVDSSNNFNLLQTVLKTEQSSQMDMDDGGAIVDMSMSESLSRSMQCFTDDNNNIIGNEQLEHGNEGKQLFDHVDASFEAGLNQTAISHASSTVNEIDVAGPGLQGKQEEETINTKFAMRELSMMFSSPAFGVGSDRRRLDHSRVSKIDELSAYEGKADVSFGNVGDNIMLDNSICNNGKVESFREDSKKNENAGFVIFQDENSSDGEKASRNRSQSRNAFQIFHDGNEESTAPPTEKNLKNKADSGVGFQIFVEEDEKIVDEASKKNPKDTVYSGIGFQIYDEGEGKLENGDTASISDAIALLDGKIEPDNESSFSPSEENDTTSSGNGEDTADLSLLNEIFQDESSYNERESFLKIKRAKVAATEKFDRNGGNGRKPELSCLQTKQNKIHGFTQSIQARATSEHLKRTLDTMQTSNIDYERCIARNIGIARRRLQNEADVPDSRATLLSLLISNGKTFYIPNAVLPKQLRRKRIVSNTKVAVGKHVGLVVRKELGRGAYGRVLLMNTSESSRCSTVAIKVQSPTGSLAWEYTVLQRLEQRVSLNGKPALNYAFPRPVSFIALADGGLLSMSAASETGFNLVDLSNFYRVKLGNTVPELIVLHYTSIAMRIIEELHWNGKILHCDVKPDNFVLSSFKESGTTFENIDSSNLTLVDFGNAVDLTDIADSNTKDTRNTLFYGNTAKTDMQCIAMRTGQLWSYDADTFGILCCAHVLLYGTHMDIKQIKSNRWQPLTSLKRYWKRDLWKEIFDTLLNLDEISGSAIGSRASSLKKLRRSIDTHLEANSKDLYHLLLRQANMLPDSRETIS